MESDREGIGGGKRSGQKELTVQGKKLQRAFGKLIEVRLQKAELKRHSWAEEAAPEAGARAELGEPRWHLLGRLVADCGQRIPVVASGKTTSVLPEMEKTALLREVGRPGRGGLSTAALALLSTAFHALHVVQSLLYHVSALVRATWSAFFPWDYCVQTMQQLFHENYEHNRKGYIQDLHNSKIHAAITLHPNKRPAYQYRLHNYMLSRKISELRYRTIQLHRESALMSKLSNSEVSKEDQQLGVMPSFNHFQPRERDEVIEWEFLTGKLLYSASETQPPRQSISSVLRTALDDTVLQVMEMINENAKSRGRLIDFKEIQYGYRRVDPMHGVEYILDLLLLYKRHKGRKLTVPVRRHAYLQQLFSKPFFKETEELDVNSLVETINSDTQSFSFISNSLKILSSFQGAKDMGGHDEKKIHILVPLVGRYDIFLRFMDNFENTCLIPKQNVKLIITLFSRDAGQDASKHIELIQEYQDRYPAAEMTLIPMKGEFSRGLGLEMASSQFDNDTLLLFCDVDLIFREDFLQRCRDNTIQGQQVYFPIIFSQYDPKVTNGGNPPTDDDFVFSKKTGFWRDYGYGITCIYKSDLLGAGGFDTSIQGWGLEDVDLYNKVILSGLRPFRSQEVGVVHIFHPVHCDPNLDPKQYKMCLGSKAGTFASTMQLAELWLEKHMGIRYNRTLS
ncbi:Chondroitin Sulfate Synthase 3 [Manis pentadactyla]|nr:Chondroitin Sulfate Synthase 3 [Manis pentadactyla]